MGGWRVLDPSIALLIQEHAPELLQHDDPCTSHRVRKVRRELIDEDLADELAEEQLIDRLLSEECRCRR